MGSWHSVSHFALKNSKCVCVIILVFIHMSIVHSGVFCADENSFYRAVMMQGYVKLIHESLLYKVERDSSSETL